MNYTEFIESKRHSDINYGIEPKFIPDAMFDFQKYVTEYAIKKGRCAVFLDTGLGKTIIELTVAKNYVKHTNKPVLIICPLMGVGSEVYSPVSLGRKAIGVELKDSYFKQAIFNMKDASKRFKRYENGKFNFDTSIL